MNDGQCIDGVNGFTCKCKAGWTGALCKIDIDDCKNHSCQHGSKCKDAIANYTCECKPGYNGEFCEINIDDCNPDPCQNGGLLDKVFFYFNGYLYFFYIFISIWRYHFFLSKSSKMFCLSILLKNKQYNTFIMQVRSRGHCNFV